MINEFFYFSRHVDLDELPTESLVDRCVVPLGHSTPLKKNTQSKT